MRSLIYQERVTVIDVLDTGACFDGVVEWIAAHGGLIAGPTADHVGNEYIARAANATGDATGDGYGYGYGYGYGDGDGYGYGNGYGDGDGY